MTNEDLLADDSDYEISLYKLIGKHALDIRGYLSSEFGGATFKITKVEFEDGTFLGAEGEHDFPYLVEWDKQPNFDYDTLCGLLDEEEDEL
jgi:hypothetical protein